MSKLGSESSGAGTIRFGPFELDLDARELRQGGRPVAAQELPLRLLAVLLERPGALVAREELRLRLWPEVTALDFEHSINTAVRKVRRSLGDASRWVETISRRGYRFVGPVESPASALARDDRAEAAAQLRRMPFVGRVRERDELHLRAEAAARGEGSFVLLLGEAGAGKTRLLDELREQLRREARRVDSGREWLVTATRCHEREWSPPYAPIAEAAVECIRSVDFAQLRPTVEAYGDALARVVPILREWIPLRPRQADLASNDERDRVGPAFVALVRAAARQRPLLLLIDDLQWIDPSSLEVLIRLIRRVSSMPVCVIAALRYPDPEAKPVFEAVAHLPRGPLCGPLAVQGLTRDALGELLDAMAGHPVDAGFADSLHLETAGNPLFVREVLSHLVEAGKIARADGCWGSSVALEELELPASVRDVVRERVRHLSDAAQQLLRVACASTGSFDFAHALRAAELGLPLALDALDEAIAANLLRASEGSDRYEFCHALVRHVLYADLSPSRRTRIHRLLAEQLRQSPGAASPAEIAEHWLRSAELPGAEAGLADVLDAAQAAEGAGAYTQAASLLRAGRALAPEGARRARLDARLGLALACARNREDAAAVAADAAEQLARSEGAEAAAAYLADAADAVWWRMLDRSAWRLAEQGLRHAGSRRDLVWARLMSHALAGREADDPEHPGVPRDDAERRELSRLVFEHPRALELDHPNELWRYAIFESRGDVLRRAPRIPLFLGFWAGAYRESLDSLRIGIEDAAAQHRTLRAAFLLCLVARLESALGDLASAQASWSRALSLAPGGGGSSMVALSIGAVSVERAMVRGEGFEELLPGYQLVLEANPPEIRWALPITRAGAAYAYALLGREEDALRHLDSARIAIEASPPWGAGLPTTIHWAVGALWTLGRAERDGVLERNLREKVLAPDFRHPHADARLSLARLCAAASRFDEAAEWFARAREVLDEQGARPLRALVDLDEASMYLRRDPRGDRTRSLALLRAAIEQFEAIGMSGWIRRAEALRAALD